MKIFKTGWYLRFVRKLTSFLVRLRYNNVEQVVIAFTVRESRFSDNKKHMVVKKGEGFINE